MKLSMMLLFAAICPCLALGQGFETVIPDIVKERGKVTSYHVTITGEVKGEPKEVKLSDGSIFVRKKIPIGFTLELAIDMESKRRLIARQDRLFNVASEAEELSNWYVYVESAEQKIYFNDQDGDVGRGFVTKPDWNAPKPTHFDPLALGLMFSGEFLNGDSLSLIAERYSAWEKGFKQTDALEGKSRYSGSIGNKSKDAYYLIVDPGKGNWPVEMAVGSPATIKQELTIEKLKETWLPKQASFLHSNKTTKMDFVWHTVNRTIEDKLFALEEVEKKYDFLTKKKRKKE